MVIPIKQQGALAVSSVCIILSMTTLSVQAKR